MQGVIDTTKQHLLELSAKAAEYLSKTGYPKSGHVVLFNGEPQGWCKELDRPSGWVPGCIAVSTKGYHVATGGDDYNGADQWEAIPQSHNTEAISTPRLGEYWEGQGGIYAGQILDGGHQYAIIMATQAFKGKWSSHENEIAGDFSLTNGQHNSKLILLAEPDNSLLLQITNHKADGHNDFYLPATLENNLICINARAHTELCAHWSSTQYSAYGAWYQGFENGGQDIGYKDNKLAARAVRRVLII